MGKLYKTPKLVLQLQKTTDLRPLPAFDIVTASTLPHRIIRAPSSSTFLKRESGSGVGELTVFHAEDYQSFGNSTNGSTVLPDDDGRYAISFHCTRGLQTKFTDVQSSRTTRKILGIIIRNTDGNGSWRLELEDGSTWTATREPENQYELSALAYTGGAPLQANWAPRPGDTRRFSFSPLQPGTSWRPFVACITSKHLKVFDSYKVRTQPSGPQVSPEATSTRRDSMTFGSDVRSRRSSTPKQLWSVNTSDQLKTLIIVSAVWVALLEGWIKNYSGDINVQDVRNPAEDVTSLNPAPSRVAGNDQASHRSKRNRVVRWFKRIRKVIWRHR